MFGYFIITIKQDCCEIASLILLHSEKLVSEHVSEFNLSASVKAVWNVIIRGTTKTIAVYMHV